MTNVERTGRMRSSYVTYYEISIVQYRNGDDLLQTINNQLNCAHFESKVAYGETSFDSYDLWYAPGVGLVRSIKTVENYARRLEYVVDELKEYEIP